MPSPPQASLNRRVMHGTMWTTMAFGASSVLKLGSNLVLTRLLLPEAFGLVATVLLVQFLLQMVADIGIRTSVIRSDHSDDPVFVSTAWVLQFARSGLVAFFIILCAAIVAALAHYGVWPEDSIYNDPRTPWYILFGALASIAYGVTSIKMLLAERQLSMAKITMLQLAGQIGATIASISIAALTGNAIALAIGIVINPMIIAIGSYIFLEGPSFSIKIKKQYVHEILSFGLWILFASFLSFFAQRGAQLLFGLYLTKEEFSFLAIALILITIARTGLRTITRRVALPAFSELRRQNPEARQKGYAKMRMIADGVAMVAFLGALFLSGPVLNILYPDEYSRVIYYVQLMSITFLFIPFELLDTVLLSEGASKQFSATKLVMAIAVWPGLAIVYYFFDIRTTVMVSALVPLTAVPITLYFGGKVIPLNYWREAVLPMIAIATFGVMVMR